MFTHLQLSRRRRDWSRVLVGQRATRPFSSEYQAWIARKWLPTAMVLSPEVLVRLATTYITTQVQCLPVVYRSFGTIAAARTWLLQQPSFPLQ